MPDTRARITKRARSTEDAERSQKMRVAVVRLPLYKDHNWMCEQLGIPPRDKLASLNIRREVKDLCRQHGFELTRKYSSWPAKEMRKLVKKVTTQLNADPRRKKVIPTTAVDALVHKLCLDNVRNMRVAQEKKCKGHSDEEEDRNSKDEEDDDDTSSDEDTPAAPTEPPYAQHQAVETDMDYEDGHDDKQFRHLGGGKWSVNESHSEIDEQLGNRVTDMPNGDLNGQTPLADAHHHKIRLPPCRPVRAKCDDETHSMNSGLESRSFELNPARKAPPPVATASQETVHRPLSPVATVSQETVHLALSPVATVSQETVHLPLSPVATVSQETVHLALSPVATVSPESVHLPLPHASECDTRTSILVHFGNESPSNAPVVISRGEPFHMVYLTVAGRVPCNFDQVRLIAIVPKTTEMVYLDTEQPWARLTARREVVRLILVLVPHTEDISLAQASQCDTRTSILVHFGNESPSNTPVVIPRAKPFHLVYLSVTHRVPCNFHRVRLIAIVPETTEMVYLGTEQAWVRLTARMEVVRLILMLIPHTDD
ncbi:hypothetical protein FN846DRAFT_895404 [Sphaerosporella brunnea]|uniref:Uncharacterized protein n=1 Tax=Sphaerosporella brunnea TaxID=1250544 RepID=A0A5J5EF89_9PEZI|nr:hypothetical protein FN846DRAFT_895404 [Sphaerosporella brunnea]